MSYTLYNIDQFHPQSVRQLHVHNAGAFLLPSQERWPLHLILASDFPVSTKHIRSRSSIMFLLTIQLWRRLAASVIITVLFFYSWLSGNTGSDVADNLAGRNESKVIVASVQQVSSEANTLQPIPAKIWQIYFKHPRPERVWNMMREWEDKNPAYDHMILDDEDGRDFVKQHYGHDPYVMNTYLEMTGTILRSDFLRYLVVAAEGGLYTDSDTEATQPIDSWLSDYADQKIRAVIGLEFDILQRDELPYGIFLPVQFCQWSFASSAHHPLLEQMVQAVTREIHDLAIAEGVSLSQLRPRNNEDVLFTSGPVKWSQEIFAYLSSTTGTEITYHNFTGMSEPRLFGDTMILPIKSFATGMRGSGGGVETTNKTLLRHHFTGTWKSTDGKMPEQVKFNAEHQRPSDEQEKKEQEKPKQEQEKRVQ